MLFSPRIGTKALVELCHRLSTAIASGIDLRTAWSRETERVGGALHQHMRVVSRGIQQGDSLFDSLVATGDFFPVLFREMVAIGEETGNLDLVLRRLAEHYQNRLQLRRAFLASIIWPVIQLIIAVVIVGGLIWFTEPLRQLINNPTLDLLGVGLVGKRGLTIYAACVVTAGILFGLFLHAMKRGMAWTRPIQYLILKLPILGKPFRTVALARLTWAMHITLDAGMELRRALRLSLRSTQNARYIDHISQIEAEISAGHSIHEAFENTNDYPADFLNTLAVGEDSGRVVESMGVLARQYQDQARSALSVLTLIAGWVVWAGVAAVLIAVVVRLFSFYLNMISGITA